MVRAPNWVGDAVMALPALRELRRIFVDSHITLVARRWVIDLFEGEGIADNIITVDDARGFLQSTSYFFRNTARLSKEKFDLAVLLQNAFGAALQARLSGASAIAGYATDRRGALLDLVVPFESNHKMRHQVRYYLNVAASIERELSGDSQIDFEARPTLHVSADQRERAKALLEESGIKIGSAPVLAVCPGATNSRAKRWLADRFAETADRLASQNGFQIIIVGTASEVSVANEVASSMRARAAMLAGRTTLAELKAILACTSLVISNDTGTAHVSAALDVPTVVIFGPTEHFATRPLSDVARVVRHEVECSPCMLRDCPIDHRCMTRVDVDDVYSAAESLLIGLTR